MSPNTYRNTCTLRGFEIMKMKFKNINQAYCKYPSIYIFENGNSAFFIAAGAIFQDSVNLT